MNKSLPLNYAWLGSLIHILDQGQHVSPRGKLTKEIQQNTVSIDMRLPVLTIPERKLSYQFMAAEAYWILSGDDSVAGIAPWNKNISAFSDDGQTFFGAYGPKILDQLNYVVEKLKQDFDTRQAGLTIWRENPTETKDVPCTVAIFANIRNGCEVNLSVYMRSSDVWLGLPYDVFNFSMLGHLICAKLNMSDVSPRNLAPHFRPGTLHLTAASMHLYEQHFGEANEIINTAKLNGAMNRTPDFMYQNDGELMARLQDLRNSKPGDGIRWWEVK